MSNITRLTTRRTPLSQLHNTTPLASEKPFMSQDSSSKLTSQTNYQSALSSETKEESEYVKTLKNALHEATDENDLLREKIMGLEALLSAAKDEIEQKDKAILELATLLESKKAKAKSKESDKTKNTSTGSKTKRSSSS